MNKSVDDYIDRGIKGNPETKQSERREYLSQLRERIILALTKGQVMRSKIFSPITNFIIKYPAAHLYLDGEISYSHLSKYIQLANQHHIPFTIVDDKASSTNIGLVLANATAIDKEDIFVSNEEFQQKSR